MQRYRSSPIMCENAGMIVGFILFSKSRVKPAAINAPRLEVVEKFAKITANTT